VTGGLSAIKGFDYQATVILARLFDHFDAHGPEASIRPEGEDDLDLFWRDQGQPRHEYIQIKKPRDDAKGSPKPSPWTIRQAAVDLLPGTRARLQNNGDTQVWLVGDELAGDLDRLLKAGLQAPVQERVAYWSLLHAAVRDEVLDGLEGTPRKSLGRWTVKASFFANDGNELDRLATQFEAALSAKAEQARAPLYRQRLTELHAEVPGILGRTRAEPLFGSEAALKQRVMDRLQVDYKLTVEVVEHTLFRNLRGFINDISKLHGRSFDRAEFELELRNVWPNLVVVVSPPSLPSGYLHRPGLAASLRPSGVAVLVEATGISGTGKTSLATEIADLQAMAAPESIVCYAEVRPTTTLRDVLIGVAYTLRRHGFPAPFGVAVLAGLATGDKLTEIAKSFTALSQPLVMILDCVDGRASDEFGRELTELLRSGALIGCPVLTLSKERLLVGLSEVEQSALGVRHHDIRGFTFEEFARLAAMKGHTDRAALNGVYERLTGGLSAGLVPQLALAATSATSMGDMEALAQRPPEKMLEEAERRRFARIDALARTAAERLTCFVLPFSRADAEEVFPADYVGAAIFQMSFLGLLRPNADATYEMHERVRAGLEATVPRAARKAAHADLAQWYAARRQFGTAVFHLNQAGLKAEADTLAREAVLRGEGWDNLASYVTKHRLVSAPEIIATLAGPSGPAHAWRVKSMLRKLADPTTADRLMALIRQGGLDLVRDHTRGMPVIEALLEAEPQRLAELIDFVVAAAADMDQLDDAATWLGLAAGRGDRRLDAAALNRIMVLPLPKRMVFARLLWVDGRRDSLRLAIDLLRASPAEEMRRRGPPFQSLSLANRADVVEFLAAMPPTNSALMQLRRSTLLEELGPIVWAQRSFLAAHCPDLATDAATEPRVRANALRALIYLGDCSAPKLAVDLLIEPGEVGQMAMVASVVSAAAFAPQAAESRLLDPSEPANRRFGALTILLGIGVPIQPLRDGLARISDDPVPTAVWDRLFLMASVAGPFAEAAPLLQTALLVDANAELLAPTISALAEVRAPEITSVLVGALSHPSPGVRRSAAVALSRRRDPSARAALSRQLHIETDIIVSEHLADAVAASGSRSVQDLAAPIATGGRNLWRCILAGRAPDKLAGPMLVKAALESHAPWMVRRAAILASANLPYDRALAMIDEPLLKETSGLPDDPIKSLHGYLLGLVQVGLLSVVEDVQDGQAFEDQVAAFLVVEGALNPVPEAARRAAARWMFEQREAMAAPTTAAASNLLANHLARPLLHSAVLRALRRAGQAAEIERIFHETTDLWLAAKCLVRRSEIRDLGYGLRGHLLALLAQSRWAGEGLLVRYIDSIAPEPRATTQATSNEAAGGGRTAVRELSVDDAQRTLLGTLDLQLETRDVVKLTGVSREVLQRLIALADPSLDGATGETRYVGGLLLTDSGGALARTSTTHRGDATIIRDKLRAAVAAANRWSLPTPWHDAYLAAEYRRPYVVLWLRSLGAMDDPDRFYDALSGAEDLVGPMLCTDLRDLELAAYLDERLLSLLQRFVFAGTDAMLEGLCALADRIRTPVVDPILRGLFDRWVGRFDPTTPEPQHRHNYLLWRSLTILSRHPRFEQIPRWRPRLESVLAMAHPLHEDQLLDILAPAPASYVVIERNLAARQDWIDTGLDRFTVLEEMAEKSFLAVPPA
jgi:Cdc6-like AAA superfamily ATPase